MKVFFWGTRGSLPNSITEKHIKKKVKNALIKAIPFNLKNEKEVDKFIHEELTFPECGTYGSNTSCVEIVDAKILKQKRPEFIICDAGSGLHDFGNHIMSAGIKNAVFHIFVSHLHWDHIQGFPFFVPAFIAENKVRIYGCHANLEEAFKAQQSSTHFPLPLAAMPGKISFHILKEGQEIKVAGFKINTIKQNHPGDSYGYSFQKYGKKIVYSTDSEHDEMAEKQNYPFLDFYRNADVLIFDAQYILFQNLDLKKSWGHSSSLIGVELSIKSNVKKLVLFHNEHTYNDEILEKMLQDTKRYAKLVDPATELQVNLAYDNLGMEI